MAAPNPVPEAEEDVDVASGLDGLAESWEGHKDIRHSARSRGALLDWGSAAAVGMTYQFKIIIGTYQLIM